MKRIRHTPDGIKVVDLDERQVNELAKDDDPEALQEWASKKYPLQASTQGRADIIAALLGLVPFPG